jgi:hypothetical protein
MAKHTTAAAAYANAAAKWLVYGRDWTALKTACNVPERFLGNLGVRCVEVTTRKPSRCDGRCGRRIAVGEKALKTSQWVESRQFYSRHAYCSDCYEVAS